MNVKEFIQSYNSPTRYYWSEHYKNSDSISSQSIWLYCEGRNAYLLKSNHPNNKDDDTGFNKAIFDMMAIFHFKSSDSTEK